MKKTYLLVAFLFLFSATPLLSQEKYDFAILEYSTFDSQLSISKNGAEFSKEKVDVGSGFNANPLLAKVNEWQEKDWEVMSFNTVFAGNTATRNNEVYFAYLRKKRK